jgi:phenylacetate-CoA ligase
VSALRSWVARAARPVKRLALGERWVRRNPLFYRGASSAFAHLADAPLESRRAWTRARLEALLRIAAHTAHGAGRSPRLDSWPVLMPADIRERPQNFVRDTLWTLPASTGGTTGVPLPLWRSLRSVAAEQAALDFVLRRCGVDPETARVAVLRGDDIKSPDDREPPYWQDTQGGRRRVFSSNHLERATVATFAEALRTFAGNYWWVYPTTLEALCRWCEHEAIALEVPLIFASSEALDPAVRRKAAERFGARVIDYYGQAERVAFAYSLKPGEWRFLPGYAHVELLPAEPDEDGPRWEIVGTGLWNEAMPLVRYRTGDLIRGDSRWDAGVLEEIALGVRPFGGILGRDREFLVAPDGRWLTGMDHLHRGVEHLVRIQIVHETPEQVTILVIPDRGYGETQRGELLAHARAKFPSSMTVTVREVEALEKTSLGKTPFIVRRPGVPRPVAPTGA